MRALVSIALLALVACSFTTAGRFEECKSDVDCGSSTACTQGYCLPLPVGCRREEAGVLPKAFEEPIRIPIAALLPLNLDAGQDDSEVQSVNAMRLAISEANERLAKNRGVFGLFVCDTEVGPGAAAIQGDWFIENLHAPAMVVSTSGRLLQVSQTAARRDAGTFLISPNATSPELIARHQQDGNVWRVPPPDTGQAKALVTLVARDVPDAGARVDVIYPSGSYGDGFANPLADQLRARGYVTMLHPFTAGASDQILTAVVGANNFAPNATVLIGNPRDMVLVIERAKAFTALTRAGGHRWYLTDSMKDPAIITNSTVAEIDQSLGTAPAQGAGNAYSTFRDRFRTRYGADPDATNYVSHSYDATWLVMLATQFAEGREGKRDLITGRKLGEGLAKLSSSSGPAIPLSADKWVELADALASGVNANVEGTSGKLDFDLDVGAPAAPYEVWQVSDGGIRVVSTIEP